VLEISAAATPELSAFKQGSVVHADFSAVTVQLEAILNTHEQQGTYWKALQGFGPHGRRVGQACLI